MVPSAAPALFLLAGQVVGLYSRFDVIVSTLHVCMPRLKFGPLHALVGCLYLSVPTPHALSCTCQCTSALCISWARCPFCGGTMGCKDTLGR